MKRQRIIKCIRAVYVICVCAVAQDAASNEGMPPLAQPIKIPLATQVSCRIPTGERMCSAVFNILLPMPSGTNTFVIERIQAVMQSFRVDEEYRFNLQGAYDDQPSWHSIGYEFGRNTLSGYPNNDGTLSRHSYNELTMMYWDGFSTQQQDPAVFPLKIHFFSQHINAGRAGYLDPKQIGRITGYYTWVPKLGR